MLQAGMHRHVLNHALAQGACRPVAHRVPISLRLKTP
jgi:hypothetical protein